MDTVTQIALGAACGEAVLGKKIGNKAPLWGAAGGLLPDLDVAIGFFIGPVEQLVYHRSLTHSILFAVIAGPLFGWAADKWLKEDRATRRDWSWLFFLSIFTHPLLDCFTTYGTKIFYPFSDYAVAFDSIFIIDPLYTVPLSLGVIMAMRVNRSDQRRLYYNYAGIIMSCAYLLLTVVTKWQVDAVFEASLQNSGYKYHQMMSSPAPFNILLWRAVAVNDSTLWEGLYSVLDKDKNVTFERKPRRLMRLKRYEPTWELEQLKHFAKGFYMIVPGDEEDTFIDMRFGSIDRGNGYPPGYVFSFVIPHKYNGDSRGAVISRRPPDFVGTPAAIRILWNRIWGK